MFSSKELKLLLFAAVSTVALNSCGTGTGPGSEIGGSVFISAVDINPSYIEADVVSAKDYEGNDGICDEWLIAGENVQISITFKSQSTSDAVEPSDVKIYKYTVEYVPRNGSPQLSPQTYETTCSITPDSETTCNFTVASHALKDYIYANNFWGADYDVKIKIKANEILYDNDISINVNGGYIIFDQFVTDNDDDCSPLRPPY